MKWLVLGIACGFALDLGASPKSDYMIHCMGCHQQNGQGMPPEVPAFDTTLGTIAATPEGRAYLVRVPGASQALLDDAELAGLMNWLLLRYASMSPDFVAYDADEVGRYRRSPLASPAQARQKILSQSR